MLQPVTQYSHNSNDHQNQEDKTQVKIIRWLKLPLFHFRPSDDGQVDFLPTDPISAYLRLADIRYNISREHQPRPSIRAGPGVSPKTVKVETDIDSSSQERPYLPLPAACRLPRAKC